MVDGHSRCDEATDTDWLLDGEDPVARNGSGNGIAICSWCFLAEPFEEIGCVRDLAFRVSQRLPVLPRDERRQIVGIVHHQLVPFPQHTRSLSTSLLSKLWECRCSYLDSVFGVGLVEFRA